MLFRETPTGMSVSRISRAEVPANPAAVAVIGLGMMGLPIAGHIVDGGFELRGFDPRPARRRLLPASARRCTSASQAAAGADVLVLSLPSVEALHQVAADIAPVVRAGAVVIETSTLPVTDKDAARQILAASGAVMLDCPIAGTSAQARQRDLVVFVSGPQAAARRARPVLEAFARAHRHVGPFGAGMNMKAIANMLIAIHNVAAAEALTLARKSGLDPALVLELLTSGPASSRMLEIRGPRMIQRDFAPLMPLRLWQKDLSIIGGLAADVGSPTLLLRTCAELHTAAVARGLGEQDSSAVCQVLEALAGLDVSPQSVSRSRRRAVPQHS